jgi:pimeloyl-ACP methyl ester carboxylesterase
MREYAESVIALLDGLDVASATLVGHHTGAHIALEAAVIAPSRVDCLVLSGLFALESDADRPKWREYMDQFRFEPDSTGEFLSTFPLPMLRRDFSYSPEDPERFLLELVAYLQAGPLFWWAYHAMIEHESLERLERVRQPTLFLNQSKGRVVEETKVAHAAFPGSSYVELSGSSEIPMDDPQSWVGAIADFIDANGNGFRKK